MKKLTKTGTEEFFYLNPRDNSTNEKLALMLHSFRLSQLCLKKKKKQ